MDNTASFGLVFGYENWSNPILKMHCHGPWSCESALTYDIRGS